MSVDLDAAAITQLRRHSFLPASEIARLGGTSEQGLAPGWVALLEQSLDLAADRAQPPVSSFRVGAAALGQCDARHGAPGLYLGANLELPGLPLNASVHAEQAATAHAWSRGEQGVLAVATSAMPCGHCRQFLCELGEPSALAIVAPGEPPRTLEDLLPAAFGPDQLGVSTRWMKTPFVERAYGSSAEAAARAIARVCRGRAIARAEPASIDRAAGDRRSGVVDIDCPPPRTTAGSTGHAPRACHTSSGATGRGPRRPPVRRGLRA